MKKLIVILFLVLFTLSSYSQNNITNTLGTNGVFSIKDISTTFLSLNQNDGFLNLNLCFKLPNTTSSSTGVIYKGADIFLHNYGTDNTFLGINSGNFTLTGYGDNTAIGSQSLCCNTTGYSNTVLGSHVLFYNTTGFQNTAIGNYCLRVNNTGYWNTVVGANIMWSSGEGIDNTVVGAYGLYSSTTGNSNSVLGFAALGYSTTGSYNTAMGNYAVNAISTGWNNTAIGNSAQVPDGTLSNQVRIGNTDVTYAGVQVAWTITSDRRWKQNILPVNLGLNFVSKLNPVSYTRINDESQKTEYGFIGQEVDSLLKEFNIDKSGMITITDEGMYELRYNDFFAPMVKSIQELNEKNTVLKSEVDDLKTRLTALEQKSGTQNTQTAGFMSGNSNTGFWLMFVFSMIISAIFFVNNIKKNKSK